jgi:hypothetical protein
VISIALSALLAPKNSSLFEDEILIAGSNFSVFKFLRLKDNLSC